MISFYGKKRCIQKSYCLDEERFIISNIASTATINASFLSTYVFSTSVPIFLLERLVRVYGNGAAQLNSSKLCKIYSTFSNIQNRTERLNLLIALADATPTSKLSHLERFVALSEGKSPTGGGNEQLSPEVVEKWCQENSNIPTVRFRVKNN